MNNRTTKPLPAWPALIVGAVVVFLFAGLGAWQVSRGLEKGAAQHAYQNETGFKPWQHDTVVRSFQRIEATGRYDAEHQIILDNIIVNSRNGHFVITPFEITEHSPLLLVNRGWIEKSVGNFDARKLDLPLSVLSIRGRVGALPRAGFKMGDAFDATTQWPKHAVYPSAEEVSLQLGREIQPFVLLMESTQEHGFFRHWAPTRFGPGKHFGYALQWFAMGAVLSGLLAWNYYKRRFKP